MFINFSFIGRLTFGTGFLGHFAPLEASGPFLAILLGCTFIINFVNVFIYQKTKSIASTTFFSALLLTLIQTGKILGNYV
ncbi:MAG: hypothetical protein ACTSRG_14965 [Candidatus Helarchaeota archaeon]